MGVSAAPLNAEAVTAPADTELLAADLRVAVARLARRLRQQTGIEITASLLSALWSIETHGPVTLGDLAVAEQVRPPTITRIVSRLEETGLVVREVDPSDRRVTRVQLSGEGRRLLERTRSRRTAFLAKRLRSLDRAELDLLERAAPILQRLAGLDR
jgi:DNA-binding MarR family transcriptional regulator